jgi:tetratricopeptide (TPR) repeat protein
MTSHIFTALGMWNDVVLANEAAIRKQNEVLAHQGKEARHWGHYNFWLLYGYLQQGRYETARELLKSAYEEAQADRKSPEDPMILDPDRSLHGSVVQMWARYLIETRDWNGDIATWRFNLGNAFDPNLTLTFTLAMQAAHGGQAALAASYLEQFRQLKLALEQALSNRTESAPTDALYLQRLDVLEQEMLAGIETARGDYSAAVTFAGEASRLEGEMPHSFGPPFIDWPAAELLGERLLEARKYADATKAYEIQLKRARQRPRSLLGLARSEGRLGKETVARHAREQLAVIWQEADPAVKAELEASAGESN